MPARLLRVGSGHPWGKQLHSSNSQNNEGWPPGGLLRTYLMNRPLAAATQCFLALSLGLPLIAFAQTAPSHDRPLLLPGCALPAAKLIAAAAPLEVELRLSVVPSGAVAGVEITRGSGHPELDAAFASAAEACRFAPVAESRLAGRKTVEHKLTYRYQGGPPPLGMHGCFATEYPSRARRREEEGTNSIFFRVPAGDAEPRVRLSRSSGSSSLDAEALLRVRSCLANAVVRAELVPDQWYRQNIVWVLQ
jgi:TonB family protein